MANHVHWFFVPHYDENDSYFTNLKNNFAPPSTSAQFANVKLLIEGGGGTVTSFSGINANDDQVYVFGHSNGVELGSKKVKFQSVKLLNMLAANGLPSTQKVFKLFACSTGAVVKGYNKCLAEQFQELAHSTEKFPNAIVYGYTGFVVLGKSNGHRKVYTSLAYDDHSMTPTSEAHRASDRRVAFGAAIQQTTRYELEKGDGWQMVVESTS